METKEKKVFFEQKKWESNRKEKIEEGTWGNDFSERTIKKAISELESWKDRYYKSLGDDNVFDGLDQSIDVLNRFKMKR